MNEMKTTEARPRTKILVAGIGNLFLGDDAFGVEVVRRLIGRPKGDGVRVVDFGIRGFDLACALLDGYDLVIVVDATQRGGAPGTLYVVEPDCDLTTDADRGAFDGGAHNLDPVKAIQLAKAMGGELPRLRLVGCEPATFGSPERPATGLSPPVEAAIEQALALVESLVAEYRPVCRSRPPDWT
jgi:hydrogenase maturation protease